MIVVDAEPVVFHERGSLFLDSLDVHRIKAVVVFAYFDETGVSGGAEGVTAVAAYLFSKEGAVRFNETVQRDIHPLLPLDKHGRRRYSASKIHNLLSAPQFEDIVNLLVSAIVDSASLGVIVSISSDEYARVTLQSPAIHTLVGNKYSLCLLRCIEGVAQWLDRQSVADSVEYVFEAGGSHQETAQAILNRIVDSETLQKRYHWNQHSFRSKGADMPWFSAPDLLAWEWQRERINVSKPQRGERRQTLPRLFKGVPHLTEFEDEDMAVMRAAVNKFYNLTGR